MKFRILFFFIFLSIGLTFIQCKKILNQPVYSQLAPDNFLPTEAGIESVLNAAFGEGFISGYDSHSSRNIENWCTDIEWETGGGENRNATMMINFTWDASVDWMYGVMWARPYRAIRNANTVLDNIDEAAISDDQKTIFKSEARFIRALSYWHLYNWFGPVPLRKSLNDELELSRATDEEILSFIESELLDVIKDLPEPGKERNYGRPNSGAARGLLSKIYLNTKQWQKCIDMTNEIIQMNNYELFPDYFSLFKVENERNKEFILIDPQIVQGNGNNYINGAFPQSFSSDPVTGLSMQSNWNNWGAQYRLYDAFYNSFEPGDKRRNLIITGYINSDGNSISLLNDNNTRSFKYWPDPNAISNDHGNDIAQVRYADVLLSKAESLNELNGPNQESINLINQVRERAGLVDLKLSDFTTKESLRDHLLLERGWEFYTEVGIRREDQIRIGTFISSAIERGHTNAKPSMVLFPIPQQAMDANSKLTQNPGY